jgi:hypothetical protein
MGGLVSRAGVAAGKEGGDEGGVGREDERTSEEFQRFGMTEVACWTGIMDGADKVEAKGGIGRDKDETFQKYEARGV